MLMSTFDFSTLYTKVPHDKLLAVIKTIIEFAFECGTKVKLFVLHNTAYCIKNSNMNGNCFSPTSLEVALTDI